MNFIQCTLQGVGVRVENGTLIITRRVLDDVISNLIDTSAMQKNPMELCAMLAPGTWEGAFWYPAGDGSKSTEDINQFFTWVVSVHVDHFQNVHAACQPRKLERLVDVPSETKRREMGLSA